MTITVDAVYDGGTLQLDEPLELEPNTRVRVTIESLSREAESIGSFLDTARSLQLQGPPDWSANLDKYLYGEETPDSDSRLP